MNAHVREGLNSILTPPNKALSTTYGDKLTEKSATTVQVHKRTTKNNRYYTMRTTQFGIARTKTKITEVVDAHQNSDIANSATQGGTKQGSEKKT